MQTENLKNHIIKQLNDMKALDIVVLNVSKLTTLCDYMIIASGTSSRHIKSMNERLVEEIKPLGKKPLGVEGDKHADWVLTDYGDIIVHLMKPETRQFYQLEKLWNLELAV